MIRAYDFGEGLFHWHLQCFRKNLVTHVQERYRPLVIEQQQVTTLWNQSDKAFGDALWEVAVPHHILYHLAEVSANVGPEQSEKVH